MITGSSTAKGIQTVLSPCTHQSVLSPQDFSCAKPVIQLLKITKSEVNLELLLNAVNNF